MGKDLQTLNGQDNLSLWAGRISGCRSSGQNVKAWGRVTGGGRSRENGICEQTYFRWQKRLLEKAKA